MPRLDINVSCPVRPSFAVAQVAGMFDVPLADRLTERFTLDVPDWLAPAQQAALEECSGATAGLPSSGLHAIDRPQRHHARTLDLR